MAKPVVNKEFKLPHVFAILFLLTIVMAIATWFVPAGTYEMVVNEATKRKVIDPNSFHFIASNPQGVYDVFNAIVKGMIQSASMMSMVFFCGAAVEVLNQTGTMKGIMGGLVGGLKGKGVIAVLVIMAVMSIGGAVGVFANPVIAFIPLGVMLGKTMGYDEVVGWAMIYLGSYAGFNVGWANAFTAGLANELSGLDTMNGFWLRVAFHVLNLILICWYVVRYMHKIEKDPTASLTYDPDAPAEAVEEVAGGKMTGTQVFCAIITVLGFAAIIYGSVVGFPECPAWFGFKGMGGKKWGVPQYSTVFVIMAIVCGMGGFKGNFWDRLDLTFKAFTKGMTALTYAAFVIAFSRAISVIMTDGKIIHTVIYYLAMPINQVGNVVGAFLMYVANVIVNFFIGSGSGQAVTVMPIFAPLAHITNINASVAVQCFQFGDGFTNCINPTAGVLMATLGLAGIPYGKYVKWFLPVVCIQLIAAGVIIVLMQMFAPALMAMGLM